MAQGWLWAGRVEHMIPLLPLVLLLWVGVWCFPPAVPRLSPHVLSAGTHSLVSWSLPSDFSWASIQPVAPHPWVAKVNLWDWGWNTICPYRALWGDDGELFGASVSWCVRRTKPFIFLGIVSLKDKLILIRVWKELNPVGNPRWTR